MSDNLKIILGILIPFAGTTLGAAAVYFVRRELNARLQKLLLGFASGVMIAASVFSLILPAISMAEAQGVVRWVPALVGFLAGIGFLLLLDVLIPHLHLGAGTPEGRPARLSKSAMLLFAVTLHNIPEGMAVGVVFAGVLSGNAGITLASAFALSIGIALQNFPEGSIISLPLRANGLTRSRAFLYGTLSGVVEPIGAAATILLTNVMVPILPYLLCLAAGAMIYVVVEELIPEAQQGEHSNIGTIGAALGFALMMVLDIALG
ncbi:MAG TPA: ZIP family metal transporter [Clostridia bacterium]|nr:ZIP family metal transporter [Clostridia bacterium]